MPTITATQARKEFYPLIASVNRDRDVVRISSREGGTAVLMAEADYEAWQTTLHLLSTRANAEWIATGLAETRAGQAKVVDADVLLEDVE